MSELGSLGDKNSMNFFIKLFICVTLFSSRFTLLYGSFDPQRESFQRFNLGLVGATCIAIFLRSKMPEAHELPDFYSELERFGIPKSILYIGHDGHHHRADDWENEKRFFLDLDDAAKRVKACDIRALEFTQKKQEIETIISQVNSLLEWINYQIKQKKFPILIHCDQGQHRTGFFCMILELFLGANLKSYSSFDLEGIVSYQELKTMRESGFKNFTIVDKEDQCIKREGVCCDPVIVNYLCHLPWSAVDHSQRVIRTKARKKEIDDYLLIKALIGCTSIRIL